MQVLPDSTARRGLLQLPPSLVAKAGMEPGAVTVESEEGDVWQSVLSRNSRADLPTGHFRLCKAWRTVVQDLRLEAGQTICLAAVSPRCLLVSRRGEPHFSAAASQGPAQPWPLTLTLTPNSVAEGRFLLSTAAGSCICRDGVVSVPAFIVPDAALTAGQCFVN